MNTERRKVLVDTDLEYEARLELQAKMEERQREQDLKKLAALKEKYGE